MQVCTLLLTDTHASTPPLSFLQAGCPSCHPTSSVQALNAVLSKWLNKPSCFVQGLPSTYPTLCYKKIWVSQKITVLLSGMLSHIYTKRSYYKRTARCTESVSSNLVKRCTTVVTTCTTHPFNSPLSRTTRVSRYQKGKTNLDFTETRDSEWQWHQLGYMQVYTLLQTDNHANNPQLGFYRLDALPATKPTASKH